jgi:hypothetical protein
MAEPQQQTSDPYAEFGGAVAADDPYADFQGQPQPGGRIQPHGHHLVGPDQYLTSPSIAIGKRVEQNLRPIGHPMEFLDNAEQSIRDYQAQRDPSQGNWFTRGLKVLGKGAVDTASDYWEHPSHLLGDVATGSMLGMAEVPTEGPPAVRVPATDGIPWGTGGKGPLSLRGRMIPIEPVYPGAPLPEHPGVFPGGRYPEHPGVFPGAPYPTATAEQLNPAAVSQARTMPGQISREVIRPPAEPIPARTGLRLGGQVMEAEPDIETEMRTGSANPPEPIRPKPVQSKLGTPEEEARVRDMMQGRSAAKQDLESGKAPVRIAPPNMAGSAAGAANDTALFRQARTELGDNASLSAVAQRAQELKIASPSAPVMDTRLGQLIDQLRNEPEVGASAVDRAIEKYGPPKEGTRIPGPNEDMTRLLRKSVKQAKSEKPN